ncbi:MAG: nucleotidyltransferase/DNA polymerase involved in DNA repair [Candidatus Paceibacteria bacterium]|jgi:nucleotidyltransferase/DNA polymerase involved in DNA repair
MTNKIFIHIDADAFFASVEQCLHTGRDGSIGVAMSYEAKSLGVERAMPIHLVRREFPTVQMVSSDYYMYGIYSNRMLSIIRDYVPDIKRKSVDECSAEITEVCESFDGARILAEKIKEALETKLGCTFSVGISSSPLLAKMGSGMNKPAGLTIINPAVDHEYLLLPIRDVSGLGRKLCERLSGFGVVYVGDFIDMYPNIRKNFSVLTDDIYYQIQGMEATRALKSEPQKSMNRARSFKVTNNVDEIFGQLVLNFEHLMRKMRFQGLVCNSIHISLKTAARISTGGNIRLPKHTRDVDTLLLHIKTLFYNLYSSAEAYRYVSVTLSSLTTMDHVQCDLFGESENHKENEKIYTTVDVLEAKFGKPVVSFASTLSTPKGLGSHIKPGEYPITMQHPLLPGESIFRRVRYPFLGSI